MSTDVQQREAPVTSAQSLAELAAADGAIVTADDQDTVEQPCYDSCGVTHMYDHLTAVSDAMTSLGWGPYASDHEDGNGQFEQNCTYADALTTADRVITLRYVLQMLAQPRGMIASFMPKPFTDRTGSEMHLHHLEPEDLAALTIESAAITRIPLVGTSGIPGSTL